MFQNDGEGLRGYSRRFVWNRCQYLYISQYVKRLKLHLHCSQQKETDSVKMIHDKSLVLECLSRRSYLRVIVLIDLENPYCGGDEPYIYHQPAIESRSFHESCLATSRNGSSHSQTQRGNTPTHQACLTKLDRQLKRLVRSCYLCHERLTLLTQINSRIQVCCVLCVTKITLQWLSSRLSYNLIRGTHEITRWKLNPGFGGSNCQA